MIPTWGAAFGANAIFNSAEFRADLTHSAVPDKAAPGTTPTFTRATPATFTDFEGVLRTAPAGCARFVGARFVRNLLTFTEDFSNAAWVNASGNTITANVEASPINGAVTADKITPPASAAFHSIYTSYALSGASTAYSIYVKNGGYNYAYISPDNGTSGVTINLTTGATSTTGSVTAYAVDAGDGWWRVACISSVTTSNIRIYIGSTTAPQSFTGDGTSGIYVFGAQLENITGRADQTTPSEYVSVGVPGDWAGTDLVTNGTFDTDLSGWTLSSTTDPIPSWEASGRMQLNSTGAGYSWADQQLTTLAATKYVYTFTSTGTVRIQVGTSQGDASLDDFVASAGTTTRTFTTTGVATWVRIIDGYGAVPKVDNIVVKPAIFHGSMVDGVKCFPTDLSGNPLTTMERYKSELAATNLCLQSNAFTTTWTEIAGTLGLSQNAVGPDGATSAWTMTDSDAANTCGRVSGTLALTAAAYTFSIFVKKTIGAQSSYPAMWFLDAAITTAGLCTIDTTNGTATIWTAYTGLAIMSGGSARCTSYNNDYWRVELTGTGTAANWTVRFAPAATSNATQSSGTLNVAITGSAVFYGAQIELGSSASSYIATTTTAVTRNADLLTYSGGDIPNLKTLSATFKRESGVASAGWAVALSDGTISNYESISAVSATQARFLGVTGGATQWDVIPSYTAGTTSKAAFSAATNDIKMAKDGVAQTQDTSATVPTVTQLDVGHVAGGFQLSGNVGGIYGWTRNLSQSELNAVTA